MLKSQHSNLYAQISTLESQHSKYDPFSVNYKICVSEMYNHGNWLLDFHHVSLFVWFECDSEIWEKLLSLSVECHTQSQWLLTDGGFTLIIEWNMS